MIQTMAENLSFLSVGITIVIIIATYLGYGRIIRPYREYLYYKMLLQYQYRLYVHPYSILGLGNFMIYNQGLKKHGDSHYALQKQFPHYQVALSSFNGQPSFDLIDPQLIKQFNMKQTDGYYVKAVASAFTSTIKHLVGSGLLFSEGSVHKMKKKIISIIFNYEFLRPKIRLFAQICQQKFQEIEEKEVNKGKSEIKIDVGDLFSGIFGNIIVKSFFGNIQLGKLEGVEMFTFLNQFHEENIERALSPFAFVLGPNYYKYKLRSIDRQMDRKRKVFHKFAEETILKQIKEYQQNLSNSSQYEGLIDLLVKQNKLREKDESKGGNQVKDYYTIQEFIDQFITFVVAGTDTTSNTASMLIYLLALHPKVEEKLRKEINHHFKSPISIDDFTYENLKKIAYYDDVFKETLRMYTPNDGIFGRVATADHYIGKIPIKKGCLISVKIKPNHFKEQFYENPFEFDPDRWSKSDPLKINPYSFFPFSSGSRICTGQHIALLQSKVAVIFMLKKYSKITLQKQNFKKYLRTFYAAERMTTTFQKTPQ